MTAVDERAGLVQSRLIERIERVDLRVRDVDSSLRFYRDVVGLEVTEQSRERAALAAPGGPAFLTLDSTGVTQPAEARATGLFHIAVRFPDRPSLGDALARLAAAGMPVGAGDHAVSEALYVSDPDGNGVELYYDRPVDEWPAPVPGMMVPMVTLPVDLQSLLAGGRGEDAVGKRAAAGTDMGHVHLQVSDVDATARFYTQEIGLDLTARMGAEAAFLSSNGYHHHLGANTWRSRGGRPAPRASAGLARIVFAVDGLEPLERLRLRLTEHGRSVTGSEGAEVVVRDPDGIELRFVPA
ncbi:MAG TPA: VOC family protein [Actinomycetota bacterium]|nr:VOC family protein [Actinomycetota bacterium]